MRLKNITGKARHLSAKAIYALILKCHNKQISSDVFSMFLSYAKQPFIQKNALCINYFSKLLYIAFGIFYETKIINAKLLLTTLHFS